MTEIFVDGRFNENKENSPCLIKEEGVNIKPCGVRRRALLDILMMGWGMGTWLGVNGVYVQLPLLVETLPEGWALPSSMVLAVQLGNSGMLAYVLLTRLRPQGSDVPYIYGLLLVGTCALLLNSFLYDRTAVIGKRERSVAFLACTFLVSLVGCTSTVLFYPHMRHFRDIYLVTYLVGEGLSGFIPSILALVQGIGGEPECLPSADNSTLIPHYPLPGFNSTVFLLLLGMLSAISLISFTLINNWKAFKSEKIVPTADTNEERVEQSSVMSMRWMLVLLLMAVMNALYNGLMPSIQSYSCMPYGTKTYHLAVTLSAMANPSACLAGVWLRPLPGKFLGAVLAVSTAPLVYIVTTAVLSPTPPLQHRVVGEALVVSLFGPFNLFHQSHNLGTCNSNVKLRCGYRLYIVYLEVGNVKLFCY